MRAGFAAGADIVELDVHPTTDGEFAVFHDWTLDCRTDGHGVTREHSMAYLKKLDIGHGYTADGGKTFPFRGKGIGLMPTLAEVLAAFPQARLLINVKSRDPSEGEKLAAVLNKLPAERRAQIMVYGGDEPVEIVRQRASDIRTISRGASRAACSATSATAGAASCREPATTRWYWFRSMRRPGYGAGPTVSSTA